MKNYNEMPWDYLFDGLYPISRTVIEWVRYIKVSPQKEV